MINHRFVSWLYLHVAEWFLSRDNLTAANYCLGCALGAATRGGHHAEAGKILSAMARLRRVKP